MILSWLVHRPPPTLIRARRLPATALAASLMAGCTGPQSMLEPMGPGAHAIADLWWILLAILTAVFIVVMAALGYALFRRRDGSREAVEEDGAERRRVGVVVLAGAGVPLVILVGIFILTMAALDRVGPSQTGRDGLTVEIVGKQFWWEIRYPLPGGDTVVTANELHLPVDRRVELVLESDNVIHSVWIPKLHGKTDMIPGRTTRMWLEANAPGVYWGQCAEYCGAQHTWMKLLVVAQGEEEFLGWLARQRRPAVPAAPSPDPVDEAMDHPAPAVPDSVRQAGLAMNARIRRGREVFLDPQNRCAACHTIRGVSDREGESPGDYPTGGPDLTHVASRLTLAAGLLRNSRGAMGGWISNPQVLKPGNLMPRIPLEPEEMNALLEYLMSLE